jgi:hypothetical protein
MIPPQWNAADVVLVVGAIAGGIVLVIRAWRDSGKLESIHVATNSGLEQLKEQNRQLSARLESLTAAHLASTVVVRDAALTRVAELEIEVVKRADAAPSKQQAAGGAADGFDGTHTHARASDVV